MKETEIRIYQTEDGKEPFTKWLLGLKDRRGRAKIRARLDRVRLGNFGNYKSLGSGVSELKVDYGPGYRIYFGQIGNEIILLLCGGDKGAQKKDIEKAKCFLKDHRSQDDD